MGVHPKVDTEWPRLVGPLLLNPSLFSATIFFTAINSIRIGEDFFILVLDTQTNGMRLCV
ncbi:hypothetical protein SAMN05421752_103271 [Natronorubrum thiooxidans]|uniref:Uncharacterized protein n=1 Tax=Natronorubrum thiooxidans TaxID=308853 RepID=A0A1N7E7G3_9EURY|nr:hypothetical protein SAMN05421752_103271 [Natronorubrum thiooxidans]